MSEVGEIVRTFVGGIREDLAALSAEGFAKLPAHEQRFWENMRGLVEAWDRTEAGDATALEQYTAESLAQTMTTLMGLRRPRRVVVVDGVQVDAARFLVELHAGTRAQGFGKLVEATLAHTPHGRSGPLTLEEAERMLLREWPFEFDYVCGRPIKVHEVRGQPGVIDAAFSRRLYDRDAGEGAFDAALRRALEG